jgi:hypothetical protein
MATGVLNLCNRVPSSSSILLASGQPQDLDDGDLLERLLALNLERAGKGG